MLFNRGEIGLLRLAAWCKSLPQQKPLWHMGADTQEMLCALGYLRESRACGCVRPAGKAMELLRDLGYAYPQDRRALGSGPALARRLELAEITTFLYGMGADVFTESPAQEKHGVHFLPSFALRRAHGSNILGGTRLAGFLYAPQATFVPYYVSERAGIYPHAEWMTFSAEHLSKRKPPAVLYTGPGDLEGLVQTLARAAQARFKTGAVNYRAAMGMFPCPVCLVPLSAEGMRQLRVMCRPDWRQRLAKAFLKKDGYAAGVDNRFDGVNKKYGEPFLAGADMDLGGIARALELAGKQKLHIAVLDFQFETAEEIFKNKNAELHAVNLGAVEAALGLPELPGPDFSPYITEEGGTLNVTDFKAPGKAGKPP
jgi:hypothetical protein